MHARDALSASSLPLRAWFIWTGLSAVFIASALWRPPDEPSIILCPFRALTGCNCPGCGMTRAFCAIAHGELRRALRFNALSLLVFVAAVVSWIAAAATILDLRFARAPLLRLVSNSLIGKLALALFGAWWAVRLALGI